MKNLVAQLGEYDLGWGKKNPKEQTNTDFPFNVYCRHKFSIIVVDATRRNAVPFRYVPHQDIGCQKLLGVQPLLAAKAHV